MTIVIVSQPENRMELEWCIDSYLKMALEPVEVLILTESYNREELSRLFPMERVEAMASEAERLANGYLRQQAAKLLSYRHTEDLELVITDDDTETIAPYSSDTFFDNEGRARIVYENRSSHIWSKQARWVFGYCVRRFQILLPFAIRREALQRLAMSEIGGRLFALWHANEQASEFETMGEWCWNNERELSTFIDPSHHWTVGRRPEFKDWQSFRRSFRKSIAARKKARIHAPSVGVSPTNETHLDPFGKARCQVPI